MILMLAESAAFLPLRNSSLSNLILAPVIASEAIAAVVICLPLPEAVWSCSATFVAKLSLKSVPQLVVLSVGILRIRSAPDPIFINGITHLRLNV